MSFPDISHLKQLQRDLWTWPRSRAAVMVGAGLSLNAVPLAGVTSRFSTWRQLVRAMFEQLHPSSPSASGAETEARDESFNRTSPLRIASEYEAALGRDKLDRIIKEQNPDLDFQPGYLHQLLLELPWADVFTTNYDTLLERTEIPGRNYQAVIKAEELPASSSPRIVKLHGSFPSQTPFIVSEEDYRTYPRRFAPFVNTVQQALLENAFVLIGFSGDDPNFLAWTGWIRDELGDNHAPIYLVGPLSLGNADRLLLQRRGVTPIDLSPVFDGKPREQLHRVSIEWFLRCLAAAKPQRPDRWPEFFEPSLELPSGLPSLVGMAESIPKEVPLAPDPRISMTNESVSEVASRWQFERQRFPGWIVLPHQKRKPFWDNTKYWIGPLLKSVGNWPVAERLLLYRELNWRIETAMVPLFSGDTIEPFEKAVDEAFKLMSTGNIANVSGATLRGISSTPSDISSAWLEIAFALLREAREMYDEQRWQKLKTQIDTVIPENAEFSDRHNYEIALWAIWNARKADAQAQLARWQPPPRSPLASLRKAGLLAELDEVGEARVILRAALADVRRALRAHGQNIHLLSLEGWITYLLFAVELSSNFGSRVDVREEFWERWQELKAWDCSPWEQKDFFDQELSAEPPTLDLGEKEIIGFDPGQVSTSKTYSGYIEPFLPALACIRFFEQVGIPFRMPMMSIACDALENACNWIAPFIGLWSPALLVRAGNDHAIKNSLFLTRTKIAAMPSDNARRLHLWCINALEREMGSVGTNIVLGLRQESVLRVLPEVISRLAFRVSEADLRKSFSFAMRLYALPAVRSNFALHGACRTWFVRIFYAAGDSVLLEWLPELLRFPLNDNDIDSSPLPKGPVWPDPISVFPAHRAGTVRKSRPDLNSKLSEAVDWLLSRLPSETGAAWRRGAIRLISLSSDGVLTDEQNRSLGEQVWSQRGANGLPSLSDSIAAGFFLRLRAPTGIDTNKVTKEYFLSLEPACASVGPDSQAVTSIPSGWEQGFLKELILGSKPLVSLSGEVLWGIEWTPAEADKLFAKARA